MLQICIKQVAHVHVLYCCSCWGRILSQPANVPPQTPLTVTFCMDKLEIYKWKKRKYQFSNRWRTGPVNEACSTFSK